MSSFAITATVCGRVSSCLFDRRAARSEPVPQAHGDSEEAGVRRTRAVGHGLAAVDAQVRVVAAEPEVAAAVLESGETCPARLDVERQRFVQVDREAEERLVAGQADSGLNGFLFGDDAAFSPAFDVTPPNEGIGVISGFFDGDAAIEWSEKTPAERERRVRDTVAEFLGEPPCRQIDYAENDWTREEWSRGCYGAYAPPGALTHLGTSLRNPVGPLRWAGTETATEWIGYIEGAIQSGERAAAEVLA